jgi:hypothetical protein
MSNVERQTARVERGLIIHMALPFPADCPPTEAKSLEGIFYRLAVRGLAVGDATNLSCWLRPYETKSGELEGQAANPKAHGLSLVADKGDLDRARDLSPRIARKPVAAVAIEVSDGVLLHTPNAGSTSHHDWWTEPYDLTPRAIVVEPPREAE